MKKILCILMFCFAHNCFSQNIALKETELKKILCKTWRLKYGLLNGNKINGLEDVEDQYEFKVDGTYRLGSESSSYVTGTWKYNPKENLVELDREDGGSSGKIKSLSETELVLIPGKGSFPESFDAEFHFEIVK